MKVVEIDRYVNGGQDLIFLITSVKLHEDQIVRNDEWWLKLLIERSFRSIAGSV